MAQHVKEFFDDEHIFNNIKDAAVESVKNFFPIQGKTKHLVLKNVQVLDNKDPHDFQEQEKVKLNGGTWGIPIHADIDLIDNTTGHVLDSVSKMKVMTIPKLTKHRYSYIVKGNEYQVINQLRLKPGIYHRVKANEEIEAQVNSAKGRNFKIPFNRDSGVFHLKVGTANVKIYPILKDLGVHDDEIVKHWGPDILRANQQASHGVAETESQKLYKNLFYHEKAVDKPQAIEGIRNYLNTMTSFDPEVMHYQLGDRHETLNPNVILKSTQKLLKISQGEDEPDDRDSVVVKKLMSVDDFIKEKFHLTKTKNPITAKMTSNLDKKDKIRDIIRHEDFNRPIESFFTTSMLSNAEQQINPLHMMSMMHKLTFHGEGGIQSEQAVTNEARGVHPSHLGFIDPIQTPEGHNIGAVLHAAAGLLKVGNDLKTEVINPVTGKDELVDPKKVWDSKLAFPDEYDLKTLKARRGKVRVLHGGEFKEVDAKDVDFILSNPKSMFSYSTNMIPFLPATSGNRALTTAKMQEQALPLVHREVPLVQVKLDDKDSFEKAFGQMYSFKSPVTGVVKDVKDGIVTVQSGGKVHTVQTYNNFPLNSKHFLHTDLNVKPGDAVKEGQIIGDTNYVKDGHLALGTNLNVGYMPWHGWNFEDAIVISESAAKKLSSMHMHKESIHLDDATAIDRDLFRAHYPGHTKQDNFKKLDEGGLVRLGEIIHPGETLATVLRKATPTVEDEIIKNIHKSLVRPWKNHAMTWDHDTPGEVVKIGRHGKRLDIYIKTVEPAVVGDKLAGRHGNKGVIASILPDGHMPHDTDGNHMEILLNPQGVPSRMNLGTVMETAVAKTAKKTGKPFIVENFTQGNYNEIVKAELKKHGFDPSGTEVLFDPEDGKELGKVLSGLQYFMKLDHSVSKKFNARAFAGYTSEGIPSRGSDEGGQSADPLFLYSMLSHGARENLYDMTAIKAERNDEFWRAFQANRPLPPPKPTFVFNKFIGLLNAAGVNVDKKGNNLILSPMTDAHTLKMSNGKISNARGLLAKNLTEEPGGLFDPKITGGISGSKYSHIELSEAFPNPMFEDAIKTILGINESVYTGLIEGKYSVNSNNEIEEGHKEGNISGGEAFKKLLSSIDVASKIKILESKAIGAPAQKLNKLHKEIRYLKALKERGYKPDVYVMQNLPVIPPKFRPITPQPDGNLLSSDLNYLYKDIFLNNQKLDEAKGILPEEDIAKLRQGVYQYLQGLYGLADAPSYRKYKGILDMIRGNSQAKEGLFQAKLVSRRQDLTARSTIIGEPSLGPDQVGLPEAMAKEIYKPFVVRRLVGLGFSPLSAEEQIEKGSLISKKALEQEMASRPVLLNRAPSLHKFSVMAFKPHLIHGDAIHVAPLPFAGFSADVDGDTMSVHIPVSEKARQEAWQMMPTNHLENPGTGKLMLMPSQEGIIGLYKLTHEGRQTDKVFATPDAALKAMREGKIFSTDMVKMGNLKTSVGRYLFNELLPKEYRDYTRQFDKKSLTKVMSQIKDTHRGDFGTIVNALKDLGNKHATKIGYTINLNDFTVPTKERDAILDVADKEVAKVRASNVSDEEKRLKTIDIYNQATDKIDDFIKKQKVEGNGLLESVASGARGSLEQVRQTIMAPMLLKAGDSVVSTPARRAYSEGLSTADYFIQSFGARSGAIDRSKQTALPGFFSKRLVNTSLPLTVTTIEDPDDTGVEVPIDSIHAHDRYLAADVPGIAKRGDLINSHTLEAAKKKGIKSVMVMSPLTSTLVDGIAAKSYGLHPDGKLPSIGDNLGALSAQTVAEVGTQLQMKTFHCFSPTSLVMTKNDKNEVKVEQLDDLFSNSIRQHFDGHYLVRIPKTKLRVWDGEQFVEILEAVKHDRDKEEIFYISFDSGYAVQALKSHPALINRNDPRYTKALNLREIRHNSGLDNKEFCELTTIGYEELRKFETGRRPLRVERARYIKSIFPILKTDKNIELEKKKILFGEITVNDSVDCGWPSINTEYADPITSSWLYGIAMAEGSRSSKYRYKISQKNGKVKDRIKTELEKYDLSYREVPEALYVNLRGTNFFNEKEFNLKAPYKKLPDTFIGFSKEWLSDFLCSYLDGDGYVQVDKEQLKNNVYLFSTSHVIAQQIQCIAEILGGSAKVYSRFRENGNRIYNYTSYCIKVYLQDSVWKNSTKFNISDKSFYYKKTKDRKGRFSKFGRIKEQPDYVYDLKTSSGKMMVSGVVTSNTGGIAKGGVGSGLSAGMERLLQLFEMPDILKGAGTLSLAEGTVERIDHAPQGGNYVSINGIRHYTPATRVLKVKLGDKVGKGDLITDGVIKPQELLELKGMRAVQDYLVDEVHKVYAAQGTQFRRPIIETVVKPLTNLARVVDPGDLEEFVPGDYANISYLLKKQKDGSSVQFKPILKGINTLSNFNNEDWLSQLNTRDLKKTILQGAAKGWSSDIHGTNPIAAWVYGAEFGRSAKPGRY